MHHKWFGCDTTGKDSFYSWNFVINSHIHTVNSYFILQGQFKAYSPQELGEACSNFDVDDSDLKVWLETAGNNEVCISDVFIDTVNKDGITRGRMCRFDSEEYYNLYVQGKSMLPLSCN